MDDGRVRTLLDRAVANPPARGTWDDVLARARRSRRGRRSRTTAFAVLVGLGVLFASLATAGRLRFTVSHTHEPHIAVRATLVRSDGSRAGTLEIEVQRVMITLGRRVFVDEFQPSGSRTPSGVVPARWFVDLDRADADAKVALRGLGRGNVTLCRDCGTRASGRVDLSTDDVAALLNADASVAVIASDGRRAAAGTARLVRSQLRRGLICSRLPRAQLHCTRIYTGRP